MIDKKVYDVLNQLHGEPVSSIGRWANMLGIGIGNIIKFKNRKGDVVEDSIFALHVQSTWRIVNKTKKEIILASSDFYIPNSSITDEINFEWDIQGNNLFDEKSQIWLRQSSPLYITDYRLNNWGDLQIFFSNDNQLDIFTDVSDDTEVWRFFKRQSDEADLVFTGLGYEF